MTFLKFAEVVFIGMIAVHFMVGFIQPMWINWLALGIGCVAAGVGLVVAQWEKRK